MKRILSLLLSVCMLLCLAACHENGSQPRETESIAATEGQPATESQAATEATENPNGDDTVEVRLLTLEKTLHTHYEWAEDSDQALVRSENSCVTLGQADAQAFPEMAAVLRQIAAMQENAMLDEFDNLVSFAKDELSWGSEGFETLVSTLDVQVRRADSLVISLLLFYLYGVHR